MSNKTIKDGIYKRAEIESMYLESIGEKVMQCYSFEEKLDENFSIFSSPPSTDNRKGKVVFVLCFRKLNLFYSFDQNKCLSLYKDIKQHLKNLLNEAWNMGEIYLKSTIKSTFKVEKLLPF